jgi:hypothetical protein
MAADHVLGPTVSLCSLTAMPRAPLARGWLRAGAVSRRPRALRQLLRRDLARVRIEQLLMDVDAHCGFSRHLVPPLADPAHGERETALLLTPAQHYSALMAALVAHGTNLGIWAMANSTQDLTVRMLQHVSRTCLREETIRRANAALVNYHRTLPLSRCWGEGQIASSDGQRFGVRESSDSPGFSGKITRH